MAINDFVYSFINANDHRSGPDILKARTDPHIHTVNKEDGAGGIGIDTRDGTIQQVVASKDGSKKYLSWVSDCAVHIVTETSANNVTEFTFRGLGAQDGRIVHFTLQAEDTRVEKFKVALRNVFGAANRVGKLDFEMVQRLSLCTKVIKRVEIPVWDDNIPLVPGLNLLEDREYRLSPMTPANVFDGDIMVAKDLLRTLLKTHPYAPLVVDIILGAPAVARWMPDERIGLALWGLTGTLKTTFLQTCMTAYGRDYESDRHLLKHGKAGTTLNAALEVMASAGMLPQILDNVKTVDIRDHQLYVSIIQAVIEGSDKQRGKKDGGNRDSKIFRCTPIITGEIRPEEASTDARVCNLTWSKPDLELLGEVQSQVKSMPIIGYHWLRFLAETNLNLSGEFAEIRSTKERDFSRVDNVNAGRLASIYTVLKCTWDLLCKSPFGEVFQEATEEFYKSLDRAIEDQRDIVNHDTEVSKFLYGIEGLQASQPNLFQDARKNVSALDKPVMPARSSGKVIGKLTDEGLFLLPNETLAELNRMKVFTQIPTVDSMTKALAGAGKLVTEKDGKHLQVQRRINAQRPRGWLLAPAKTPKDSTEKPPVEPDNQQREASVSTNSTVSTVYERKYKKEDIFSYGKSGGDSGGNRCISCHSDGYH